jgi:FKBP-type peptidyl-prolyl cis-trans isomerase
VSLLGLSPRLGVPEDSLRSVGRGVWIHDIQVGTGDSVVVGRPLAVHYVGQLADGQVFGMSRGAPFRFTLGAGSVIDGWEDGLKGMRVGGRRQLVVPSRLGYGAKGEGKVPPDAVLIFDVTLVEVGPAP